MESIIAPMPNTVASPAPTAAADSPFSAPAADLRLLQQAAAVLARLDDLGRLRIEGADAVPFLQSQLTNDVAHLPADALQLTGYCTPKGRLLATFQQWRDGDALVLQLPREILAAVQKRLSMFVLRAKVRLVDVSAGQLAYGLIGAGAAASLRATGIEPPGAPWTSVLAGGLRIARLPAAAECADRFMIVADAGLDVSTYLGAPLRHRGCWWWSETAAAVPTVFAATQERFVPQMLNFEVLGGVNFKKGCYPGQEIVARSQYLGKLRRRMQLGHIEAAPPAAGTDVFHSAQGEPVGTVVMAAAAPRGGSDLLCEVPVDRLAEGSLHVAQPSGERITLRALPYELFDPTA